ncbi:TPA: succinate dehydrogenase iron-sulfur subunit [Candidatus Poribacteria bacterium]|nr:succinate dehydrogenase iron-sulfur subunit [Candidatus Poribacteria bacterium]
MNQKNESIENNQRLNEFPAGRPTFSRGTGEIPPLKRDVRGFQRAIRLKIFRYDSKTDKPPRYEEFEVRKISEQMSMTVLEALLQIQDERDGTLAFRYSCRGAVCGSCAMLINGKFDLACRVQLQNIGAETIVLEPLPNLNIIKDLVVDMAPFWDSLQQIQPWLHEISNPPKKERLMSPKEREKIDQYVNCILCAACYGSCPVLGRDEKYLGPAALAKLYRFIADTRDSRGDETLKNANTESGVWGCDTVFRCIDACPKNVRPTDGIEALRRNLIARKFRKLFASLIL